MKCYIVTKTIYEEFESYYDYTVVGVYNDFESAKKEVEKIKLNEIEDAIKKEKENKDVIFDEKYKCTNFTNTKNYGFLFENINGYWFVKVIIEEKEIKK